MAIYMYFKMANCSEHSCLRGPIDLKSGATAVPTVIRPYAIHLFDRPS